MENNQENEIVMYQSLLNHMMEYFYDVSEDINNKIGVIEKDIIDNAATARKKYDKGFKSEDVLNKQILLNSMEILELLLQLNMFAALANDRDFFPLQYYSFLLKYLLRIFIYDKRHIKYVIVFKSSEEERIKKQIKLKKEKEDKLGLGGINLDMNLLNMNKQKQEAHIEDDEVEQDSIEESLYRDPIMRG